MVDRIPPHAPLVLLHAFPLNAEMWARQKAALDGRTVLAPDLPGFGSSPPGEESLDGFAEQVVLAMDAAGIERAVVAGLSMGGYVALRLWDRWPERVAGLVLADTRAGADSPEAAERREEQASRARNEGVAWLAESMLPNVLGPTTLQERPEVVEHVRRMMEGASAEGVARALLAMRGRPDSTDLLRRIDVPVLAIVGEEDTLTPPAEARLIAESVPDGRLEVLPGAGHLSNLENPEAFEAVLGRFLAEGGT
jgi:pimeloyl-ACP methyl ester carboxylesterase